jgi:hypothetical protein
MVHPKTPAAESKKKLVSVEPEYKPMNTESNIERRKRVNSNNLSIKVNNSLIAYNFPFIDTFEET